ncbi:phage tail-collar fiber domain-containing protein [Providencia sp. PROV205]|uniref:phage tail-collar fiber domain-containing protein n=1 Tax=Providencia sp. PROV205 TaxID=2949903 RepID=UPI00234A60D0|nr:phage tail protein [Providencia sp. PROV205]
MASVITVAFENWKAQEAASGKAVLLDEFVFANVPNLDPTKPIDRNEKLPPANQIVHRQAVNKAGLASENAVAYSVTMGADVGNFDFNWIGLLNKASGTVAMITHAPPQKKIKNQNGQQGNVLTRSFILEFQGAAEETQIKTSAETWQIDFTARLSGIDEMQRLINVDSYGAAAFFNESFEVTRSGEQYTVKKGLGYVGGLRGELTQNQILNGLRNTKVYADFSYQGNIVSQWNTVVKITSSAALNNYVDAAGFNHQVFAIASIDASGNVKDLRPMGGLSSQEIAALETRFKLDLSKKIDKANITHVKGNSTELVVSQQLLTTEVGKLQPSGNYLNVGDGGWMKDIGVSLNNTAKLSNYRINSIGYAYASISTDTFKNTNNIIFNLFGYLNNKYGAQIAVIPNTSGDIGFRVISNDVVGDWMELAKKSYVDNALSNLVTSTTFKAELDKKLNTNDITQTSGTSTTQVPSQNAVSIWMNDRYTKSQVDSLLNNKMNTGAGGWMANRGVALTSSSKLADYRLNSIGYAWNTVSSDLFLGANNLFLNLFGYTDSTYGAQLAVIPSVGNERIGFRVIQSNNVGGWIEFATKNYVDNITLGKGQKYHSEKTEKVAGTNYTNTTAAAIYVCASIFQRDTGGQANISAYVDSALIQTQSCYARDTWATVSFIVPPGSSYRIEKGANINIEAWSELR